MAALKLVAANVPCDLVDGLRRYRVFAVPEMVQSYKRLRKEQASRTESSVDQLTEDSGEEDEQEEIEDDVEE